MHRVYRLGLVVGAWLIATGSARAAVTWREVLRQPSDWYGGVEAGAIATSVLQYQTKEGGWPKNHDMTAPPDAEFLAEAKFDHRAPTIDNNATSTELQFLARVASAQNSAPCRAAVIRGLDYLLAAQYENGGWPQYFPLIPGYYTHITYNDNAMANVLVILRDVSAGNAPWQFVDADRRAKAADAVRRGIACILRTQVKQHGQLTAWCAQHDEKTFAPVWARNFEPPSLSGEESVNLVRFLMGIEHPSPEVVAAIEGAIGWFQKVGIHGLRIDNSPGADGKKDRHVVSDETAPVIWARFYELGTDRPIYIGRDRVIRYDFNAIERERRAGYSYLGPWPVRLLAQEYPQWLKKNQRP